MKTWKEIAEVAKMLAQDIQDRWKSSWMCDDTDEMRNSWRLFIEAKDLQEAIEEEAQA